VDFGKKGGKGGDDPAHYVQAFGEKIGELGVKFGHGKKKTLEVQVKAKVTLLFLEECGDRDWAPKGGWVGRLAKLMYKQTHFLRQKKLAGSKYGILDRRPSIKRWGEDRPGYKSRVVHRARCHGMATEALGRTPPITAQIRGSTRGNCP